MWLQLCWLAAAAVVLAVALVELLTWATSRKPIDLKDKHVLITGGSSGIGLAIAELAVAEGARVTIMARNAQRLEAARRHLLDKAPPKGTTEQQQQQQQQQEQGQPVVFAVAADAADETAAAKAVGEAVGACGPIHVLVCCQGVSKPYTFEETPMHVMRELMEVNYWGSVSVLRAALPSVKLCGSSGRIVLVSSQAGQMGLYGYAAYAASKFALRGLAESLQQELIGVGTRVCMVFPPDTDTPQLREENKTKPEVTKLLAAQSAVQPLQPSEMASYTIEGMKRGDFMISGNFDGFMLSIATAGMAPLSSPRQLVVEVLLSGILRVVAAATIANFNGIVLRWTRGRQEKETQRKKGE